MNVLGLDSATEACSAAIWRNNTVVARRFETMQRGHAEVLMSLVKDVMQRAGTSFSAIDLIATTIGPGGFTGLRIGLASARALALAGRIPIIGVTTMEAVAQALPPVDKPLLIALDSKRRDIYVQLFDCNKAPLGEPSAMLPSDLEAILPTGGVFVGGNASEVVFNAFSERSPRLERLEGPVLPDAAVVAAIGAARYCEDHRNTPLSLQPLYLRPPDAQPPAGHDT
jgi:tRNA threonylcarbamoyladenosine biosynthesis protein TsaB